MTGLDVRLPRSTARIRRTIAEAADRDETMDRVNSGENFGIDRVEACTRRACEWPQGECARDVSTEKEGQI